MKGTYANFEIVSLSSSSSFFSSPSSWLLLPHLSIPTSFSSFHNFLLCFKIFCYFILPRLWSLFPQGHRLSVFCFRFSSQLHDLEYSTRQKAKVEFETQDHVSPVYCAISENPPPLSCWWYEVKFVLCYFRRPIARILQLLFSRILKLLRLN